MVGKWSLHQDWLPQTNLAALWVVYQKAPFCVPAKAAHLKKLDVPISQRLGWWIGELNAQQELQS